MLDNLLEDLIIRSIHAGWATTTLKGGLIIYMTVQNGCVLTLTLRRVDNLPSDVEWHTIIKHFPWPTTAKPIPYGNNLVFTIVIHTKYLQKSPPRPLPVQGRLC